MMENPALRYFYDAQTCYNNEQDYQKALQKTSEGFFTALRNNSLPNTAEMLHQCIELTNEILVVIWSQLLDEDGLNHGFQKDFFHPVMKMCSLLDCSSRKNEFAAELSQMKELICNLDAAWKKEYDIIKGMKDYCDENGREIKPKESAKVFKKLVNLYVEQGLNSETALFVHCLINAMKIRDADFDTTAEQRAFDKWLSKAMPFKMADVAKIVKNSKSRIKNFRSEIIKLTEDIPRIGGKTKKHVLREKEIGKIQAVRKICTQVEKKFSEILQFVSMQCFKVLPIAPSQFYHVAVLPRHKITPKSSFQSFLVLPDEDLKYKEYFEIYNLLFKMVIAGISETPLHSLGVPFFRDANDTKWFFDEIAECGIHINNSFVQLEEIITVSQLLDKFSNDKCFRNEMVFLETICIGGEKKLFEKTESSIQSKLPENMFNEILNKLRSDLVYDFSLSSVHMERLCGVNSIDVEHAVCSVISSCVSAMARLHGVAKQSCYDITNELHTQEVLNDHQLHDLKYALSISYEVVLKKSLHCDPEVEILLTKAQVSLSPNMKKFLSLFDIVGKHSTLEFLKTLIGLQTGMQKLTDSSDGMKTFAQTNFRTKDFVLISKVYMHFRLYKDTLAFLSIKVTDDFTTAENVAWNLNKGMCNTALTEFDKAEDNLVMAYALLTTSPQENSLDFFKNMFHVLMYLGLNAIRRKSSQELKQYFGQARELCEMNLSSISSEKNILWHYLMLLDVIASVEYNSQEYDLAFSTWNELERKIVHENKGKMSLMRIGVMKKKAESLLRQGCFQEALAEYYRGLNAYNIMSDAFNVGAVKKRRYSHVVADILTGIAECNFELKQIKRALAFCDQAQHYASRISHGNSCDVSLCKLVGAKCHLSNAEYKHASSSAFDAFNCAFIDMKFSINRTFVLQESVKVVFDCSLPSETRGLEASVSVCEDLHTILHSASAMYMMFKEREQMQASFKRDMTILLNVIQTNMFEIGNYRPILQNIKSAIESKQSMQNNGILNSILEFVKLHDTAERSLLSHHTHLLQILRNNISKESVSIYGSLIIFVGYLNKVYHHSRQTTSLEKFTETLSRENNDIKLTVASCGIKFCIYLMTHYASKDMKISRKNTLENLLQFASDVGDCYGAKDETIVLRDDKCELLTLIGEVYLRSKRFKKALVYFHDALQIKETMQNENLIDNRKSVTSLRENIQLCLANSNVDLKSKENTLIDVSNTPPTEQNKITEKQQLCEQLFSSNDFVAASKMAFEIFDIGVNFLKDYLVVNILADVGHIAIRCALNKTSTCMTAGGYTPDKNVPAITENCVKIHSIIQANSNIPKLTELLQPLTYALAHCYYAVAMYKKSLKMFKHALGGLACDSEHTPLRFSLHIKTGQCYMALKRFHKAQIHFEDFLSYTYSMRRDDPRIERVHSYLSICFVEQGLFEMACRHATLAFASNVNAIQQTSCDVIIMSLQKTIRKFMDID